MLAGGALVGVLSLKRSLEIVMIALGVIGLGVSGAGIATLSEIDSSAGTIAIAITLGFGSMVGGYGLASSLLTAMAARTKTVSLLPATAEDGSSNIAILLLAAVEPERYDPAAVAYDLRDWAFAGLPEPTIAMTPFLFAAQKARYRAVGGSSGATRQTRAIADRLGEHFTDDRFERVELVTCLGHDTLAAAVARCQGRGIANVIVAQVDVGESFDIRKARNEVDVMRPDQHGMNIAYTAPLWGSDLVAGMMADRIATFMIDSQPTGVVLVMHGQPEARELSHQDFDVQENAFANRVRMLLSEHGLPETSVRLCWAEWRTPDVTESVRHLAALGCARILVSPVCFPFESLATVLDLAIAVKQARTEPRVYVTTLQPWGDDPIVIEALTAQIEKTAEEIA